MEKVTPAKAIQVINFSIEIGVIDIILKGDLAYAMDKLRSNEQDNSWLGAMVETSMLRISIMHGHKNNFI